MVILQREGEDGAALFDGIFTFGVVGERGGDEVEGGGGGPGVCEGVSVAAVQQKGGRSGVDVVLPSLSDIVSLCFWRCVGLWFVLFEVMLVAG